MMCLLLSRRLPKVALAAYIERAKARPQITARVLAAGLSNIERGTQHDEVTWTDVAVHACQILNARKNVVFVAASELASARDSIDHVTEDGHEVIAILNNVRPRCPCEK
jgi:hypothetical protein